MSQNSSAKTAAELSATGIRISVSESERFAASLDNTRYSALPDCVAHAEKPEDIGRILRVAHKNATPVTVRGRGTGCAAGCVPFCGGIVLDVSAIDFIEIDAAARVAHVGAGAVTADIDAAARKFGLMYAPDPSSHKYSSIGGNIACNAGGLRAAKYGVTREHVLALSAFLADGTRIKCGLPLRKFSAGPNLRDFFIGSEGTFGVVSEAWLKLLPAPEKKRAALAYFDGDSAGFEAVEKIMLSPLQPAVLEFMDVETVACVGAREPSFKIPRGSCALLAEFDSADADAEASLFISLLRELSNGTARAAKDDAEAEELWRVRRSASPAMYGLGNAKLNQDIVLPLEKTREFFKFFKQLGNGIGLPTPVFGHAADGNYHIHFMYDANDEGARSRALEGMRAAIEKAIEMGGAVSGEHGIGALKSKYMAIQHGEAELKLMRAIKRAFDPKNILNPEKVYTVTDLPNAAPFKGVKLPWD